MPRKVDLIFNPELHKYTDADGNVYRSVTTVCGDYKEPFDKEYWAEYTARKRGVTKEQILAEWKHTTDVSLIRGNGIHNDLEENVNMFYVHERKETTVTELYGQEGVKLPEYRIIDRHELENSELKKWYPSIYRRLLELINEGFTLFAEKRIYSAELLVAGTIDLLAVKGKHFYIIDWKTNKDELMFQSGYFKKKWINGEYIRSEEWVYKPKYLLYPLNDLEECKGNLYALQLSTYAHLVELWGFECIGLELFHIRDTKHRRNVIKKHRIPYYKQLVTKMLEHNYTINRGNNNNNAEHSDSSGGLRIT